MMLSSVETTGELSGIEITQAAMVQHFGSWASIFLAFAIFTFAALDDYMQQRLLGKNPVFYASSIPGLKEIEWWGAEKQTAHSTNLNEGVEKS